MKPTIRLIIAGGRSYEFTPQDFERLDKIANECDVTEVVSGAATGADTYGEHWAALNNIPVKRFCPNWKLGKFGPIARNGQMASYADAVALFPGGRGTEDMHKQAAQHGLLIFDFRGDDSASSLFEDE